MGKKKMLLCEWNYSVTIEDLNQNPPEVVSEKIKALFCELKKRGFHCIGQYRVDHKAKAVRWHILVAEGEEVTNDTDTTGQA